MPFDGPLSESLARIDALCDFDVSLATPSGPEWVQAAALCDPQDPALPALLDRCCGLWGTEDPRIAASMLTYVYAQRLVVVAVAAYVLERRVPDLAAANVAFELGDGRLLPAIAVAVPRGASDASRDDGDLLAWLGGRLLEHHLEPFMRAVRTHVPVSERVLRGNVAACFAGAFVHILQFRAPDLPGFRCDADACLAALGVPLDRRLAYLELQHAGRRWLAYRRGTCCLSYRRAGSKPCLDCVLVDDQECTTRMRSLIDRRLAA